MRIIKTEVFIKPMGLLKVQEKEMRSGNVRGVCSFVYQLILFPNLLKMTENLVDMYNKEESEANHMKGFTKTFVKRTAEKRVEDVNVVDMLNHKRSNNLVLGAKVCEKAFKNGKAKKVYTANNCDDLTLRKIQYYASLVGAQVVELNLDNEELGQKLGKPFLVSMVCVVGGKN